MKAKELRIGNLVYFDTNEIRVVDSRVIGFCANSERLNQLIPFQPIPLTEEMLLKCKGVKSSYTSNPELIGASKKYDLGSIIIFQPNEDESVFYTCINEYMDNLIVDALHQLQNLYFALTGQELEINL